MKYAGTFSPIHVRKSIPHLHLSFDSLSSYPTEHPHVAPAQLATTVHPTPVTLPCTPAQRATIAPSAPATPSSIHAPKGRTTHSPYSRIALRATFALRGCTVRARGCRRRQVTARPAGSALGDRLVLCLYRQVGVPVQTRLNF